MRIARDRATHATGRLIVCSIAILLLLAACGDSSQTGGAQVDDGTAEQEGTVASDATDEPREITLALSGDIPTLDPQATTSSWTLVVYYGNVSEALTWIDQDGEVQPGLATSWEQTAETTWRYELREGVQFHNGEPFDAHAAKYSLDRARSEELGAHQRSFLLTMESVDIVDDYTIDVHTTGPDPFINRVAMPVAIMVPPKYTESAADAHEDLGIGTGPYRMVSRATDEVVLEKFMEHWDGVPTGPERVRVVARPEVSSRIAGLQAGELDIIEAVPADQLENMPNVQITSASRKHFLLLNPHNGVTQNPLVREAIVNAVDQEGNREAIYGDTAEPAGCQIVEPGVVGYVDAPDLTSPQPYDPERATTLLEEADAVGATVRLLVATGRYQGAEQIGEIVAQQLEAVGLDVELILQDYSTFKSTASDPPANERIEIMYAATDHELGIISQPWGYYWLDETSAFVYNFPDEEYPETQEKMIASVTTLDEAERERLFEDIARDICESNAAVFMQTVTKNYAYRDGLSFPGRKDEIFHFESIEFAE